MRIRRALPELTVLVLMILTACSVPAAARPTSQVPVQGAAAGSETASPQNSGDAALMLPTAAATRDDAFPAASPTYRAAALSPTPTFDPDSWQQAPVLPTLSKTALAILQDGLARGNNPHAFSKIGDCESQAAWFLSDFDGKLHNYALGSYSDQLEAVIPYYQGSFQRVSLAARPGFTAASLMAPIWADKQQCQKDETPLACEYRLQRPLAAFIMLGSNDASNPKTFEGHMRKVIEFSIAQGVLPILGTKADNVEGNHFVNATIARLAYEYDLPLWNFWAAVHPLPDHGLQEDGVHLTFAAPFFDDPAAMRRAWPVRNLNALQILTIIMDHTP